MSNDKHKPYWLTIDERNNCYRCYKFKNLRAAKSWLGHTEDNGWTCIKVVRIDPKKLKAQS